MEDVNNITELNSSSVTSFAERVFLATILGFVVVAGTIGNCIVIASVVVSQKLRTSVNIFIVNLSLADLLTSLNMVWIMVAFVSEDGWPLPDWLCVGCGFVLITCIGTSVFTLSCIALNRVILITTSISTYRTLFKPRRIVIALVLLWAIPMFLASIPLYTNFGKLGYSSQYMTCIKDTDHPTAKAYDILLSCCLYPLPTVIITTSYFRIWNHVRNRVKALAETTENSSSLHTRAGGPLPSRTATAAPGDSQLSTTEGDIQPEEATAQSRQPGAPPHVASSNQLRGKLTRRQMEVTKNMFYIVCIFYMCVSPYGLSLLCAQSCARLTTYAAVILSVNSCINFFVYAFKHPDFKVVIRCILLCKLSKIPNRARIFRR